MEGDGWDFGDMAGGFLIGWLLAQNSQPRPTGHTHGDHWHQHVCPNGYHVHDGHPDGPIRIVPPTPEQVAAEEHRRANKRLAWGIVLGIVGLLTIRTPWLGVLCLIAGLLLGQSGHSTRRQLRPQQEPDVPAVADPPPALDAEPSRYWEGKFTTTTTDLQPTPSTRKPHGYIRSAHWDVRLELVGKPHVVSHSGNRLSILVRVTNHGRSVDSVRLAASLTHGRQIVGIASNWMEGPSHGETRSVELTTYSPPPHFDRIELQVDNVIW